MKIKDIVISEQKKINLGSVEMNQKMVELSVIANTVIDCLNHKWPLCYWEGNILKRGEWI